MEYRSGAERVCLLLVIATLWFFSSNCVQGRSCVVDSGSPVTLQAMQSGEVLSGNLTVPADCIEKRYWRRDKHEPKVMPLCVEALSLHLIQSFICGGLGLQYGGYWSKNSHSSECYSMKYQQVVDKGREAKLVCHIPFASNKETLLNISDGESVNIKFPLPIPKEEAGWPQPLDSTGIGFMMQVNRIAAGDSHETTTAVCLYPLLNMSDIEEKNWIVEFWNASTSRHSFGHHRACNFSVYPANFSQTATGICNGDGMPLPSSGETTDCSSESTEAQEKPRCNSCNRLVEELVLAFIILALLLLVIMFGSMLVYNYCKSRYPKGASRNRSSTLLPNDYTGSNSQLAADYIPMKTDPGTTAQATNGHMTCSETSRNGAGVGAIHEETEVKYDELTSCSQRSFVKNSNGYSHLSYNN